MIVWQDKNEAKYKAKEIFLICLFMFFGTVGVIVISEIIQEATK